MDLQIQLQDISKRFSNFDVIKNFNYTFNGIESYAILGSNGSGKSTLVKLLSGLHLPTKGKIHFIKDGNEIATDQVFQHVSLASPWSDVIEDLTLEELLKFHFQFRKPIEGVTVQQMIEVSGLEKATQKFIHQFSSGMKQRTRLILAFFTQSDILLLDEPTSNLDADGKQLYQQLIKDYKQNRLVIVASNHLEEEYGFCSQKIEL